MAQSPTNTEQNHPHDAAENTDLLRVCIVGTGPISTHLFWHINPDDATCVLVWRSSPHLRQKGIRWKSMKDADYFRRPPAHIVERAEDAKRHTGGKPFDYVIANVKYLPEIYDIGGVIESLVEPRHTCIVINATQAIGIESTLQDRFPNNVVLSMIANLHVKQVNEFSFCETKPGTIHLGQVRSFESASQQFDQLPEMVENMAATLSMVLQNGGSHCEVTPGIIQKQFDNLVGAVAFQPASVVFNQASHKALLEAVGVREVVLGIIDEMVELGKALGCKFAPDYKNTTVDNQTREVEFSEMFREFKRGQPILLESYLGSPIKLAREHNIAVPRIETMYAMLHHVNNQSRQSRPPNMPPAMPTPHRPMQSPNLQPGFNGPSPYHRVQSPNMMLSPNLNGHNQFNRRDMSRESLLDDGDLSEFSHVVMYDDNGRPGPSDSVASLPRQYMQDDNMGPPLPPHAMGRPMPPMQQPMPPMPPMQHGPPMPPMPPRDVDMMSYTSRKNRKVSAPPEARRGGPFARVNKRASDVSSIPELGVDILDDPLLNCSSNRYGTVDRAAMGGVSNSRANSMTSRY